MVSGGWIISGSEVSESLLFTGVRSHSFSMMNQVGALPYVEVGRDARLSKCVVDRGCVIPPGMVVGEDAEEDAKWFRRTDDGVVLITKAMLDARAAALG